MHTFAFHSSACLLAVAANFAFSCDGGGTLVGRAYVADDVSGGPFLGEVAASDACTVDGTSCDGRVLRPLRFTFVRAAAEQERRKALRPQTAAVSG